MHRGQLWITLIALLLLLALIVLLVLVLVLPVKRESKDNDLNLFCTNPEDVKTAGAILSAMDTKGDPCQNFYHYACGGFELQHNIPAGKGYFDQSSYAANIVEKQLRNLLEKHGPELEPQSIKKMRRYYDSCLDIESVAKVNILQMRDMVSKMGGLFVDPSISVPPNWSLEAALAAFGTFSEGAIFSAKVGPDERNVNRNAVVLEQGSLGLGLGTKDYYVNKSVTEDPVLVALTNTWEKFARLILGETTPVSRTTIIEAIEFDKKRAEIQASQRALEDRLGTYNKVNISWLQDHFDFVNWNRFFCDMFFNTNVTLRNNEEVILFWVPYFTSLTPLIKQYLSSQNGKRILQNNFVLRAISRYASKIAGEFQAIDDAFQEVFTGTQGSAERWRTCLIDVDQNIGFPLSLLYIQKYFSPSDKSLAESIVSETLKAFRTRVQEVDWMDAETRKKALEKAESLRYRVGYPEWLFDANYMSNRYADLTVTDDYINNLFGAHSYSTLRQLNTLRQNSDKSDWAETPHTVSAWFEATQNILEVPAGVLARPFFYTSDCLPSVLNFGSTGATAGHEYDKHGNLNQWWSDTADAEFQKRSLCYLKQFDAFQVDGVYVRGNQTLGENIADDGGLKAAFQAWQTVKDNISKTRKIVAIQQEFTEEQLFFIAYAQGWCSIQNSENLLHQILTNEHAPARFRVLGPLANSGEFAKAFNCKQGTPMNPVEKCSLW